jgi:methylenetetrahydrofolate dehydrogenase (NADP+)/methenyltetrahydrofolate cyclohydrolase
MAIVMKGTPVADSIYKELSSFKNIQPTLGIIKYRGTDAGGYLKGLSKSAQRVSVNLDVKEVEDYSSFTETIKTFSMDENINGILLLKPFPKEWDFRAAVELLPPHKDVDCLHPVNLGLLAQNRAVLVPATPQSIMRILDFYNIPLEGKNALIIGRSEAVGLPASLCLLYKNATITVAHSRTRDIPSLARQADLLVVAIGKARFVTEEFVKPGAVVVDVGTNVTEQGKVVGDVDYEKVEPIASAITPVPGGVGSVTTACMFRNLFLCYQMQHE